MVGLYGRIGAMKPMSPATAPRASSPDEAIALMTARLSAVRDTQVVPWSEATGRVLASAVVADRPSPPSDVSAMDGYALRLADASGTVAVTASILPGEPASPLQSGCARVMTGGVVPAGAELVIRREDVEEQADRITIKPGLTLTMGQNIRRRGENLAPGSEVIGAGRLVDAPAMAALTTFGVARVSVFRRLRVRVIVTGDELLPPEAAAADWQIRDSNGPALMALLGPCRWVELLSVARVKDDFDSLARAVGEAVRDCDALVLTGGVSAGTHDFVPDAVRSCGGEVVFHRLPLRPGGPLMGAVTSGGQAVFGLPGNPMSVMATGRRVMMPVLASMAGISAGAKPRPTVRVNGSDGKTLKLWWYRPVKLVARGTAELVTSKGSGDVVSVARSDGFVEFPPEQAGEGPWPFYTWSFEA
jgi:molybdopterin molybdotransferase